MAERIQFRKRPWQGATTGLFDRDGLPIVTGSFLFAVAVFSALAHFKIL